MGTLVPESYRAPVIRMRLWNKVLTNHAMKNASQKQRRNVMPIESAGTKVTTDHGEIQRWVDERGGHPARVKDTQTKKSAGVLRIDYPGFSGEDTLEPISWQAFFEAFEENNLAFLYQEETKDGSESRFSKLIDRDAVKEKSKAASK
jgi:hypothetical protein